MPNGGGIEVRPKVPLFAVAVVLAPVNPVEPDEPQSFLGGAALARQDGPLRAALDRAKREAVERSLGVERVNRYRIVKRHGIPHELGD